MNREEINFSSDILAKSFNEAPIFLANKAHEEMIEKENKDLDERIRKFEEIKKQKDLAFQALRDEISQLTVLVSTAWTKERGKLLKEKRNQLNRKLFDSGDTDPESTLTTLRKQKNDLYLLVPQFYRGILATGKNFTKGEATKKFIDQLKEEKKWNYDYAIFVDDNYQQPYGKNDDFIGSMKALFEEENIPGEIFWMKEWKPRK